MSAGGTVELTVDFTRVAYPPLVSKWGGVAHPQWDNVTDASLVQLTNDTAREAAVVLGVIQMGTTMSNDTTPIFERDASGAVRAVLDPRRLALRQARGGANGVTPVLQFDGCPTPAFTINASSVPSPHARFYPMCAYDQLDELAAAFAAYARQLHEADGLPTSWSWWPEPAHTLSNDQGNDALKLRNFERYLDFYVRAAPAVRAAVRDDAIAGWQLNAANCDAHGLNNGSFCHVAMQAFLARERRAKTTFPLDAFTLQDYKGAESATLVANARLAMCSAGGGSSAPRCPLRFALTPVTLVRFMESKDVHPDYATKEGVAALLDEYALTADLPDVSRVAHSRWEDFYAAAFGGAVAPMVLAALRCVRGLPVFRAPVALADASRLTRRAGAPSAAPALWGLAASNASAQCFILWSRRAAPLVARLTLRLRGRRRPAAAAADGGAADSFVLYTLGPKHAGFVPLQTVRLPPPPAASAVVPLSLTKPYQVVQGCIRLGAGLAAPPPPPPPPLIAAAAAAAAALYARHDVLVPRAADPEAAPAGMGHYDAPSRTLTVAFAAASADAAGASAAADNDDERVGVAGVVLRAVAAGGALALSLHAHLATAVRAAAALGVRLDFLNGSAALGCTELASKGAEPAALWAVGPTRAWPAAAERGCQRGTLPAFDALGRARVRLDVRAPEEWVAADDGARRVRLSLLARPVGSVDAEGSSDAGAFTMAWDYSE